MSIREDARRLAALATEACAAVVVDQPGAAREWLRLLIVEASRLDVALAGTRTLVVCHVEQVTDQTEGMAE